MVNNLPGETAKQIFERARLPNETLGRIWNLADTKQRGALDATEFIIAMHLLTSFKSGAMRGIPQTIPPGLYDAAARRGVARSSVGSRHGADVPPVPAIPKQFTGPQRTQSPIHRQFGSPVSAHQTGGDWLVTPQEKSHYDSIFSTVDTAQAGMISGDQAVPFFMNAQLSEETLAQIWDLADIDADGQLTKDEFAVAMYLVRQQRGGKEPLPQTLPPALIPPSMRHQAAPAPAAPAAPVPATAPAPAPVPRSAADDLFGLDSFAAPAPAAPSQVPQSTGGSNPPFQAPGSPTSRGQSPSASTTFKPFVPTSSFGQSLQPQTTGTPSATQSPPPADDLLGDNDPEESKKLTQETTELANLSNQIGSLANEMQNVQTKRSSAEQNLSQTSQQKRDFETRLSQARAMYEEEVKNFKALEERLNASKSETGKLQQEYAMVDGSRQDLRNQYEQVSAALAADQQENASLKEKIRQANAEVAQLKPALEKARSDGRQQKGLAAINKKQLATVEGERDKMQEEISGASKELPETSENPAPEAGAARVASPAASTTSQGTNPFFKRTVTGSSDNALSPQVSNDQQRAFENLFGPSFGPPSTATPPPPTSFRSESPAAPQPPAKSPATSGAPTPSISPAPSNLGNAAEPPALSQSRQMTPSALPFGESQSTTSSTMVSPPGSRFGGPDISALSSPQPGTGEVPSTGEPGPISPTTTGGTAARSPFDEVQESSARFPELPADSTEETGKAVSPGNEDQQAKDPSFDELFGGPARQRSQSQKENDFDEAFATMKTSTNGTSGAADGEFPPIREIDNGEDESSDDEGRMGFDDNFTPVAPTSNQTFPAPGPSQPPTAPPAAEEQTSPPKYEESVPKQQEEEAAPELKGLVPRRSDPTLFPDAPHSVESSTGAPVVGGEPQHEATKEAASPPAKNGKPDFDAAFAGLDLAPAKEAEDEEDEDPNTNDNKDFDFSFDAPQQKATSKSQSPADFFNFDNNVKAPSPGGPQSTTATSSQNHDWDALFAPLDNPTVPGGFPNGNHPTHDQESSDKREPGWALSAGTGEDDQILQRLTGMGFPRDDSLSALEKFDYNIDKVLLPLKVVSVALHCID